MSKTVKAWLAVSLFIGGVISLFASSHPDGLEKAGEETGYINKATSYLHSPLPDYTVPGVKSWLSSSMAGLIGVLLTFGVFWLMGKWLAHRNK
ncbi:PDGLE domain-containing protein [Paenibacillus cremeus]|uniref:PDGLE domain-containing protein n=1 Tax=Paenibacillus cremeus TaxID=2163881 RepID=A0A559KEM2_9BACL|nr:PDGLE domain-containing protein [Paenibacillus cremeus]TVY10572.1 hypothetical protein FPZ49_07500 [Paenibacillus cremeus]